MKTALLFIFALTFFTAGSSALAQSDRLSETDYDTALAKALDAASIRDRRVSTEEKFYAGTELTGVRNLVSEFAGPDAKKVEVTEEFNGKRTKSDSVKLGEQFFCREGDKGWKKANKDCAKKGGAMAIPAGDYEYSVEPDPNNFGRRIYTRRATYTDAGLATRDAARLKFIEIKFITDETGAILEYTETRRGGVEPNNWSSTQATFYDYNASGLRITDPRIGR